MFNGADIKRRGQPRAISPGLTVNENGLGRVTHHLNQLARFIFRQHAFGRHAKINVADAKALIATLRNTTVETVDEASAKLVAKRESKPAKK